MFDLSFGLFIFGAVCIGVDLLVNVYHLGPKRGPCPLWSDAIFWIGVAASFLSLFV